MLNLKNTLDGYLKNVEVIGNTIQDTNNLADIRSVGDKIEGQELYKIPVVSCGKNLNNTTIKRGNIHTDTGIEVSGGNTILCTSDFIQAKPLTKYVVSSNLNISGLLLTCYNKNKDYLGFCNIYNGYFETKENTKYIKFRFKKYNNEEFTDLDVSNINVQFEEGTVATEYEPYQENKLEILSPVQLEKIGDVEDRIIEKNGVWGVEKKIITSRLTSKLQWYIAKNDINIQYFYTQSIFKLGVNNRKIICNNLTVNTGVNQNDLNGFNQILAHKSQNYSDRLYVTLDVPNVDELKKWLDDNHTFIKYYTDKIQFIPLPHDQQVKLRTFAGQTNIAFLTEIPGQIKAQVPKSLGATVNTHTEQIKDLHNSLERVKKLEETTVSTVETESSFTTVNETSNGYFEDVKLEGKILVNLANISSKFVETTSRYYIDHTLCETSKLDLNKPYTFIIYCNYLSNHNTNYNYFEFGAGNKMDYFSSTISTNAKYNRIDMPTSGIYTMLLEFTDFKGCEYLACRPCRRSLAPVEGEIANYDISILLLEGDHTNNPPSYFKGLLSVGQDVEEVSVESVNKNLFDGEGCYEVGSRQCFHVQQISNLIDFTISYDTEIKGNGTGKMWVFLSNTYVEGVLNHDVLYQRVVANGNGVEYSFLNYQTIKNAKNYKYIYLTSGVSNGEGVVFKKIQLESNSSKTKHIPHKSNKKPLLYYNPTTETWEKPILREWDTIEKHSDGKYYYHKRSGEVVLNGVEDWKLNNRSEDYARFELNTTSINMAGNRSPVISNKFSLLTKYDTLDKEGLFTSVGGSTLFITISTSKLSTQDAEGFKAWLKANPTTVVYHLAKEEVYECTNIDLMTYSGETNYIVNSGAISPKSILKVHNNISNVVKILQEKVSLLENTFIAGLKSVLSGDMYSLATILYPEDFEQNDNTEQDIMIIPE